MNIPKLIVDLFGIGIEIFLAMLFYRTIWHIKVVKKRFYILGFSCFAIISLVALHMFTNQIIYVIIFIALTFMLGIYFNKSTSAWIFFSLVLSAIFFISEIATGLIHINVLGITMENIQSRWTDYAFGLLCAKLITLILIYTIRFFISLLKGVAINRWYNIFMVFLPSQSLMLCFLVFELSPVVDNHKIIYINIIAVFISLILIFITMYIMNNQLKAMTYREKYEIAQKRWQAQIKHYDDLYLAQKEIRAIRHDMKSMLTALMGLLNKGSIVEAIKQINNIQEGIQITDDIIDTGYPAIDAIVSAVIKKASDLDISIEYKIIVESLYIDQCDIALILANALENAIEAISKSVGIEKKINLHISNRSDYLFILVENQASVEPNNELRTTKVDIINHGFGIYNMKTLARKYDGTLDTRYDKENQTFSVEILIKNKSSCHL